MDKIVEKFKMASETCFFVILLPKLQFSTDFKNLDCIRSVFLLINFCRKNLFSKIQNGGFFEDDVIFEKKSTFFKRVLPTINSTLFKFSKNNLVVQRPKIYQKNLPKKIFQDGGYFQKGVCTFFSYENMSCDRYFRSIELIFELSHYFLTFNFTKINFEFLDYRNMGLSYKILINKRSIHVILVLYQLVF
jgi:hypothetical protein